MVGLGDERRPQALVHAPLAVVPVPFPRRSFEQAYTAAPVFNALVDAVARDGAYLRATLRPAAEFDDFTVSGSQACQYFQLLRCCCALQLYCGIVERATAHLCKLQACLIMWWRQATVSGGACAVEAVHTACSG